LIGGGGVRGVGFFLVAGVGWGEGGGGGGGGGDVSEGGGWGDHKITQYKVSFWLAAGGGGRRRVDLVG